jgi:hypothetical protein
MDTHVQGWTGDSHTEVMGRRRNTLLLLIDSWNQAFPAFTQRGKKLGELDSWYPALKVRNLARDASSGLVLNWSQVAGGVFELYLVMVTGEGDSSIPWKHGVNLFSLQVDNYPGAPSYNLMATAVIDNSLRIYNASSGSLGRPIDLVKSLLQQRSPTPWTRCSMQRARSGRRLSRSWACLPVPPRRWTARPPSPAPVKTRCTSPARPWARTACCTCWAAAAWAKSGWPSAAPAAPMVARSVRWR